MSVAVDLHSSFKTDRSGKQEKESQSRVYTLKVIV